jgi:molybdopterin converting factor small subunit
MEKRGIRVRVRFFAAPREAIGAGEIERELPAGATVGELIDLLTEEYPVLRAYTRFISVAVNRAYVGMQTNCTMGTRLPVCLPSGGGETTGGGRSSREGG